MPLSFSVVIAGVVAAAPGDGFIDHTPIERYMADGSFPTTFAHSQAKERANTRFSFLQQQLQFEGNVYMTALTATGGSATAAPSEFTFTGTTERDYLIINDELTPGATLTGVDAMTRLAARALIIGRTVVRAMYDPTETLPVDGPLSVSYERGIARTESLTVAALAANLTAAEALVTVTEIV